MDRFLDSRLVSGRIRPAAFGLSPARASCALPTVLVDGPTKLHAADSVAIRG
jgi:hypothetical protein